MRSPSRRSSSFLFTLSSLAALAVLGASSTASAQNNGFAANRFEPSEKGSDWFTNESLDLRGAVRPAIGALIDYSRDNVVFLNPDGSHQPSIVSDQFFLHLGASLTLADRVRLGLNVPLALYNTGNTASDGTTQFTPPGKAALGDIRVGADLRLLGEYKGPAQLAIGAQVWLPTGSAAQFTGDEKVRFAPRVVLAGDILALAYSIRAGYELRSRAEPYAGRVFGDELLGGVAVGVRLLDRHFLVGPEVNAATLASDPFKGRTTPGDILLGAHYTWSDWRVGGGLGTGLDTAYGSPTFRLLLGLEWSPAIEEPPPPPPPPPSDRDHDGIADKDDACPDTPGIATNDPKTNGCPPPPADRDGDGILDVDDACPDTPGVKTDDPKTNGCPPPPPDRDKDGIADADDACPDVPGVKTDDPKTNGCPSDRDKDGIVDTEDACPDQPGPKDPDPKKNGCPLAFVANGQINITQQVKFAFNSAQLLKESDTVLNAVLQILKDHPEIKKLRVEGHTDNKGNAAYNKTLSGKRAASVVGWMVMHGIDKGMMSSQGFGQDRPIDDNSTDAGRQNNRRVEFHIDDGSTPPATPPPATPAPKK